MQSYSESHINLHPTKRRIMEQLEVHLVALPPIRVACFNGFSEAPESLAIEKMKAWAKKHNISAGSCRLFGHNNPDPTPGSPNYGYDIWLTVEESFNVVNDVEIIAFPGGLYAVTRCIAINPMEDIPLTWQKLVRWMQASKYHPGRHQWLEEHIVPLEEMGKELPFTLDLYLPISE
jgi:DNA gyrase inhibitor GyrI